MPAKNCLKSFNTFAACTLLSLAGCQSPATVTLFTGTDITPSQVSEQLETDAALKSRFGITGEIQPTRDLGGLSPALPMAQFDTSDCRTDSLRITGSLLGQPRCRRYLVEQAGEIRLIATQAELREQFAPIDTPAEAVSFALAAEPSLSLSGDAGRVPRVRQTATGYELAFYDSKCGGVNEIRLSVDRQGQLASQGVTSLSPAPAGQACDG